MTSCAHDHAAGYELPLTEHEKGRIRGQLLPLLFGVGLLALGAVYGAWRPDQRAWADAMQACAALLVAAPVLRHALRGFLSRPTHSLTEQLVAIAILASMAIGDFITAALVPLFLELGHLFEERSSRGARAAIDGIRALHASQAQRLGSDGTETAVDSHALAVGDTVVVRPSEVIPVDGEVLSGRSSIDQAPITGESLFEAVEPGSRVFSGTVNVDGLLHVRAVDVGGGTVLGRVLRLLQDVEQSKTPILRLLERYAAVYLPLVLAIAAATLFVTADLSRAIAILIVACPCALVLAGPAAMVAAMTAATRLGVLIKSAAFLEKTSEIKTLLLDKTGTVTGGRLVVTRVTPHGDAKEDSVLRAAARCGVGSRHPVSRAVVEHARVADLVVASSTHVQETPGEGVCATSEDQVFRLGRRAWLAREGVEFPAEGDTSGTTTWVSQGERLLGSITLADEARPEARQALDELRTLGVERMVLLTGDRQETADAVAASLGFDDIVADVLPEQKLDVVRREQQRGPVMMVGDGVNDALALAGADVGVAMGARVTEVALDGADVAVSSGDLTRLPQLLRLGDTTRWIIVLNALIGTGFSLVMMGAAAVGWITPLIAALLHNAGSLLVLANSSRIPRWFDGSHDAGPYLAPADLLATSESDGEPGIDSSAHRYPAAPNP